MKVNPKINKFLQDTLSFDMEKKYREIINDREFALILR